MFLAKVVKLMINAGCDPDVGGVYGKTVAHCLVQRARLLSSKVREGT